VTQFASPGVPLDVPVGQRADLTFRGLVKLPKYMSENLGKMQVALNVIFTAFLVH